MLHNLLILSAKLSPKWRMVLFYIVGHGISGICVRYMVCTTWRRSAYTLKYTLKYTPLEELYPGTMNLCKNCRNFEDERGP